MLEGDRAAFVLLAAALACVAGMAWLALAMERHWAQVCHTVQPPGAPRRLQTRGAVSLVSGLALCLCADPAAMAVLAWVMVLAVSAGAMALVLAWRPRWLRALVPRGCSHE